MKAISLDINVIYLNYNNIYSLFKSIVYIYIKDIAKYNKLKLFL